MRSLHGIATHAWDDWSLEELLAAKAATGTTVSLVVPARNEAATVGDVVTRVRETLMETTALIDELVVVDSDSTDTTYDVAAGAGATVHRSAEIRPDLGTYPGKGEAMWKSLFVTTGDLVVFMDADLLDWDTHFVPGLLGPLLLPSRPAVEERAQGTVVEERAQRASRDHPDPPGLVASGLGALAPRPPGGAGVDPAVEERAQRASRDHPDSPGLVASGLGALAPRPPGGAGVDPAVEERAQRASRDLPDSPGLVASGLGALAPRPPAGAGGPVVEERAQRASRDHLDPPGLVASGLGALAPRPPAGAGGTVVEERAQRASRDHPDSAGVVAPSTAAPTTGPPEDVVALVKGFYERPGADGPWEGGRVTELVARPLIATSFPELGGLVQPLAGEWAARRSLLERLWMPTGYAVELAALIDTVGLLGTDAVAQVDLGRRAHRHQALRDLGGMSTQIVAAALARLGARQPGEPALLRQHGPGPGGTLTSEDRDVVTVERPPAGGAER